ncbi:MAG: hypothetical protein ABIR57_01595, partial [Aeromicrobium sp.]
RSRSSLSSELPDRTRKPCRRATSPTARASDDLQKWEVSLKRGFDGYSKIRFDNDGATVGFVYHGKVAKTWRYGKGFTG